MARNSEQVVKEIQRVINQKYVGSDPFEQCMAIWQVFRKGMYGKELKEEFAVEYEIIYKIFKEINVDNIQLSTLHFLYSFIKLGKLYTLNDNVLETTLGQTCAEGTSVIILEAVQQLYSNEKNVFIEECVQKYSDMFDYSKSFYVGRNIPIQIICNRCNEKLLQTPEAHIKAKFPCMSCTIHIESWEPNKKESSNNNGCVHVFNGLYISDIFGAQNVNWLQSSGFGGVIDISNAPNVVKFPKQLDVLRIPVDDNAHSKIRPYFLKTQQFIDYYMEKKKKVLVFCRAGVSRSATIIINYLMKTFSLTVDEAILFLKKKRPQIQPNNGFLKQLKDEMETHIQSNSVEITEDLKLTEKNDIIE